MREAQKRRRQWTRSTSHHARTSRWDDSGDSELSSGIARNLGLRRYEEGSTLPPSPTQGETTLRMRDCANPPKGGRANPGFRLRFMACLASCRSQHDEGQDILVMQTTQGTTRTPRAMRSIDIFEDFGNYELVLLAVATADSLRRALVAYLDEHEEVYHVPMIVGNVATCLDDEGEARILVAKEHT